MIYLIAGAERFRAITISHLRNADGAFIVYDITNESSFETIEYWYEQIKLSSNDDIIIYLLGNKIDLNANRIISKKSGLEKAKKMGMDKFAEVSAKTKENLIKAATLEPTPFSLNGKTIATGAMEKVTSLNDLNMKNMYFLTTPDAKKVKVTSTLDMTKDELKKMIVDQVKKIMPSQAEMIEQNIDMVMSSGAIKFEFEQTTDYEFGSNGWVKTISFTNKSNTVGSVSESTCKMELVESNR